MFLWSHFYGLLCSELNDHQWFVEWINVILSWWWGFKGFDSLFSFLLIVSPLLLGDPKNILFLAYIPKQSLNGLALAVHGNLVRCEGSMTPTSSIDDHGWCESGEQLLLIALLMCQHIWTSTQAPKCNNKSLEVTCMENGLMWGFCDSTYYGLLFSELHHSLKFWRVDKCDTLMMMG